MRHGPGSIDPDVAGRRPAPRAAGGWVIAGMFGLALIAALGTVAYYRSLQQRPLALWGTPRALTILRAERVDALQLAPDAAESPPTVLPLEPIVPADGTAIVLELGTHGADRRVLSTRDVTKARGLAHIRQGLVHDRAYVWDARVDALPNWRYAVRFSPAAPGAPVVLLFDPESGALAAVEGPRAVLVAEVARTLTEFLELELNRANAAADSR